MTESDPEGLDQVQRRLQDVIGSLRHLQGERPSTVREQLERGIAEAGLPEQPGSWLRDCAAEIAAGRVVVIGPKEIPEEVEHLEPDPEQHATS
ncbi:hypothetical protein WDZ17_04500 [Pseudokineococcus basanitobsidens]|uniref:Uncharacterized protein n=1 Tax=Pseudokineococcus basanitobsidens TaxID=1926649 RepID=A0ABU8RHV6_9ACTN